MWGDEACHLTLPHDTLHITKATVYFNNHNNMQISSNILNVSAFLGFFCKEAQITFQRYINNQHVWHEN
jgi:hypothetical protein